VQEPVRADRAAAVRARHSGKVGEGPARLCHDDLESGQIPEVDICFSRDVYRALRDEHMGPEIAISPGTPDFLGQAEELAQPTVLLPRTEA
jgi:hypothetical protein